MKDKRTLFFLGSSLLFLGFFVFLIQDQLGFDEHQLKCWFYSESLQEQSPSELLTVLFWLMAAGFGARIYTRTHQWYWIPIALFCFAMFLEEGNYGRTIVDFFSGGRPLHGTSFHNAFEKDYQDSYWDIEGTIQEIVFWLVYTSVPLLLYRRIKSKRLLLACFWPLAVWIYFLIKQDAWEGQFGKELYPHHPCVSIDEEIYETLFALASTYYLGLRLAFSRTRKNT